MFANSAALKLLGANGPTDLVGRPILDIVHPDYREVVKKRVQDLDQGRQATEMLQQAIGASQRIMMNLRPAILDQGLVAAVQWLAGGFAKRTGIKTTVHAAPEAGTLSKAVQLVAYRTAQEALTNIAKHADCSQVTIDLSDAENVLTLEIKDNGKGISPIELNKPQAFGVRGLHERAKTVGGWLDVSTHLGSGTSIILSVPLA